jgi:alkanesulfonate monooxygenase SsuD/methylene tetrahydromethanopterin reductase-like flavin-dependent oxidoreductase (luciferase family)
MTPDTGQSLKVGILLPEGEGRMDGATASWADLVSLARLAEDVGLDSLWVPDHLLYRSEGEVSRGTAESCSLLAALAAVTNRIELGSFVTCTSFRNPALLAKIADTIDEISGGRLILGLGAGWHEPEYMAYGYPFDHRVSRFEEALVIITGLLRDGHSDFDGRYYQARDCELRPRGPRPNGPPIMIGTTGKRMLGLTAQYADLWNIFFSETGNRVERIPEFQATVDTACVQAGRDPTSLGRTAAVLLHVSPEALSLKTVELGDAPALTGTPEDLAAALRAYADAGITHVQLALEPCTPAGLEAFAPVLTHLRH